MPETRAVLLHANSPSYKHLITVHRRFIAPPFVRHAAGLGRPVNVYPPGCKAYMLNKWSNDLVPNQLDISQVKSL